MVDTAHAARRPEARSGGSDVGIFSHTGTPIRRIRDKDCIFTFVISYLGGSPYKAQTAQSEQDGYSHDFHWLVPPYNVKYPFSYMAAKIFLTLAVLINASHL
jgi:hypothetical protein